MTNKLPVLQATENEVFMELQQVGVTPVIKRYCVTCKHSYNENTSSKTKYSTTNRCSVFHGQWCSSVNSKNQCQHWVELQEQKNTTVDTIIITLIILSFTIGALVF